eukprot:NODE_290_length_10614_cov_1.553590.p13 type:complete len:110 gc:universal NODE_290_length_10614_cov_1.553590:7292-6963(-)
MDRCGTLEQIINDPIIPELLQFYSKHEKILEPFQHITDNEIDLTDENIEEVFQIQDVVIDTSPVDPSQLQELADLIEEYKDISTKLVYLFSVNHELISLYNQYLSNPNQ